MQRIIFTLAILFAAATAFAANPKITVSVDAQGYATLKAALPSGTAYNFQAIDIGGERRLLLLAWVEGQRARVAIYDYAFKDYQPGPEPSPDPKPDPKPEPQPVPPVPIGKLWTVIVEESSQLTPAQGKLITSKSLAEFIAAKGHHKIFVYDKDAGDENAKQPAQLKEYVARAKTLPFVFLVSEGGSVVFEGPLPDSEAVLLELLKKFGG